MCCAIEYVIRVVPGQNPTPPGLVHGLITDDSFTWRAIVDEELLHYLDTTFGPLARDFVTNTAAVHRTGPVTVEIIRSSDTFHDQGATPEQTARKIIYHHEIIPAPAAQDALDRIERQRQPGGILSLSVPQVLADKHSQFFILRRLFIAPTQETPPTP